MRDRAIVGMSGGVDSSVAAYLIKEAGYDVTGITMILCDNGVPECGRGDDLHHDEAGSLCGGKLSDPCVGTDSNPPGGADDARAAAGRLGISYTVLDMRDEFRRCIIDHFISEYEQGRTPSPCVLCNRRLKFSAMYDAACRGQVPGGSMDEEDGRAAGIYIATGHYAVIDRDPSGRYILRKGRDLSKDQSYYLSMLTQEQLSRAVLPLGGLTKNEVREIAASLDLPSASRRDSQDICFIPGGDYASFISGYTGREYPAGDFTDTEGNVLGTHRGIIHYTVGQRKGLGIALGKPAYVQRIDAAGNRVILGDDGDLYGRELAVSSFNWISSGPARSDFRCSARIRYRHSEAPAEVIPLAEDRIRIIFDEPQRAVTPGQTAVLYDGDTVIGGGIIE